MLLQSRVHEVDYITSRSVLVHVVGIVEIVSVLTDFACVREATDDQSSVCSCAMEGLGLDAWLLHPVRDDLTLNV